MLTAKEAKLLADENLVIEPSVRAHLAVIYNEIKEAASKGSYKYQAQIYMIEGVTPKLFKKIVECIKLNLIDNGYYVSIESFKIPQEAITYSHQVAQFEIFWGF